MERAVLSLFLALVFSSLISAESRRLRLPKNVLGRRSLNRQPQHDDNVATADQSHDEAFDSIISKYYNTDPFYGEAIDEDEAQETVRSAKEIAELRSRIPAPLMARDVVAPLRQRGGLLTPQALPLKQSRESVVIKPTIPAPLLVGGAPKKESPRIRLHMKPKKDKKKASTPLFKITKKNPDAPLFKLKKALRRVPEHKRPQRQVFSQLIGEDSGPDNAEEDYEDFGDDFGRDAGPRSNYDPRTELPKKQQLGRLPGDQRGDIPTLPEIESGEESFRGEPEENALFPGDPGAPPRTSYFDLMGDFFAKPEINIYAELGPKGPDGKPLPPPPRPPPRRRPIHPTEPRKFPEPSYHHDVPKVPRHHGPEVSYHEPEFRHKKPLIDPRPRHVPESFDSVAPPHFDRPNVPHLDDIGEFGGGPFGVKGRPVPAHLNEIPFEPVRNPHKTRDTPIGHAYAPPLSHHNPLDKFHKPSHVEKYKPAPPTHKEPKQFFDDSAEFGPESFGHVDIPKMNIGSTLDEHVEFGGPKGHSAALREGPAGSGLPFNFSPIDDVHPFSNLKIKGSLVPAEHRDLPDGEGILVDAVQPFGHGYEPKPHHQKKHVKSHKEHFKPYHPEAHQAPFKPYHPEPYKEPFKPYKPEPGFYKEPKHLDSHYKPYEPKHADPYGPEPHFSQEYQPELKASIHHEPEPGHFGHLKRPDFFPKDIDYGHDAPEHLSHHPEPVPHHPTLGVEGFSGFPGGPKEIPEFKAAPVGPPGDSSFEMPRLPPPQGFLDATRDAGFPVDVPKLGSKVPYQPPELLYDAFHSGKHAGFEHNHVKKDAPSADHEKRTITPPKRNFPTFSQEVQEERAVLPPATQSQRYQPFREEQPEREQPQRYPFQAEEARPFHPKEEQKEKIRFKPRSQSKKEKLEEYFKKEEEKKQRLQEHQRPVKSYEKKRPHGDLEYSEEPKIHSQPQYLPKPTEPQPTYRPKFQYDPELQYQERPSYPVKQDRPKYKDPYAVRPDQEKLLSPEVPSAKEDTGFPSSEEFFKGLERPNSFSEFASKMQDQFQGKGPDFGPQELPQRPQPDLNHGPRQNSRSTDPVHRPARKAATPKVPVYVSKSKAPVYVPGSKSIHDYEHEPRLKSQTNHEAAGRHQNERRLNNPFSIEEPRFYEYDPMAFSRRIGNAQASDEPEELVSHVADLIAQEGTDADRRADSARALFGVADETVIPYPESKVGIEEPHQFTHVDGYNQFKAGHNRGNPHHHIQDVQERRDYQHKEEVRTSSIGLRF